MKPDVGAAMNQIRQGMPDEAVALLRATDTPAEVPEALHALGKRFYWQEKDLDSAIRALRLGIEEGRREAELTKDPVLAESIRGIVKAMCYDLASFCWPGWDEDGIEIGPTEIAVGEAAAAENLHLAVSLNKGDSAMAAAYFIVGAYHLVHRRHSNAVAFFEAQRNHAERADDQAGVLLARGYAALAQSLAGDVEGEAKLRGIQAQLRQEGYEHGAFFADQLTTAEGYFARGATEKAAS
jgi:hypothetical protein